MNEAEKIRIDIICCAPKIVEPVLEVSIIGRARTKGIAVIEVHNLHDYAEDRYRHIDDAPFGGGAGMIIKCAPVFACVEKLQSERHYDEVIFMTPDGATLNQGMVTELSLKRNIIIIAGHFKGIDQRIRDVLVTREISIGDYILTGGELPALVLADAVVRLLPGVLGDVESAFGDSFQNGLLDAPHYTRPAVFRGISVPEVLLGGNHALVEQWREEQSLKKTAERRPDLLE